MLDSPRDFLIIIIGFILALSFVIAAKNSFQSESAKNNNFNITVEEEKNNTPTAENSETKTPAQIGVSKPDSGSFLNSFSPKVQADYAVTYTNNGFSPQKLRIPVAKSVRFINNSDRSMYIVSAASPSGIALTELNQGRSVGRDGFYDYTFNKKGDFIYYNFNNREDVGLVTVE